jgi:hypothetical protein
VLLALCACSSKSATPYTMTYSPGDASTSGFDVAAPSGTVAITILSPLPTLPSGPLSSNGPVSVSARVTITGGTDFVDPSTVIATLTKKGDTAVLSSVPLVGTASTDPYTGQLSVVGLKSGDYTLTVSAASSTGARNSTSVDVSLDAGPAITVLSPVAGQHYKGGLIVQLAVDPGAYNLVGTPSAFLGGTALTLQPAGAANQFRAPVDLTKPALTGDQLFSVSATDDKGSRSEVRFVFNVDVDGPVISGTTPVAGQIVGGVIKIAATISDGAGLDLSSLQVLIGDKTNPQFRLPLMLDGAGVYSVLFDTKALTGCKSGATASLCIIFPTLSFRASDTLGNDSTVSYEIAVDNRPPIADLVPPEIRVSKYDLAPLIDGGPPEPGLSCSHSFDPLSKNIAAGDMPNDNCVVPQVFDLRARIEDDGNGASGLKGTPISLVDPNATAMYVLEDVSQPLVVDSDGDGVCDAINPNLTPTTMPLTGPRQVLKLDMRPVPPAGDGNYTADPTVPMPECIPGHTPNAPLDICHREEPTVAITYAAGQPAIWAIQPIAPDNPGYCFGGQFDTLANNVTENGWKCIAVATADKNGNTSVSAPIRVYVRYQSNSFCVSPATLTPTPGPAPTCTGTYNRTTGTATAGACTTSTFARARQEICFQNDCD